eukprot:TRINITY_DN3346_c0_g3_i2.p2 TRINITY_DN3346_c0_g3~~TRINITY_DN3346_c0_g3_i2.p2  ORF type:complete len:137 (-),score=22.23 TRINITY_DN3346_c0_g3_i2:721-1131(-)
MAKALPERPLFVKDSSSIEEVEELLRKSNEELKRIGTELGLQLKGRKIQMEEQLASNLWAREERAMSQNQRELLALELAVEAAASSLGESRPPLKHWQIHTDNQVVMWYLKKEGGRHETISRKVENLIKKMQGERG